MKRVLATVMLVMMVGCGSPTEPGPFTQQVSGSVQAGVPLLGLAFYQPFDFTTSRAGALTLTLTWSTAADLDFYLTSSSCSSVTAFTSGSCTILSRSEGVNTTTERLTQTVTSGQALR